MQPWFAELLGQARPYFADPVRADAPPTDGEVQGNQDVVEVHRLRFERVNGEGLSSQVVQRIFQINSAVGAQFFGVDDIWYDASRSQFCLQRAAVYRHGRAQVFGSDGGDAVPHTTGNRARRIRFPRLQAGDRVELVYFLVPVHQRLWTTLGGRYLGDLFAFRGPYPVHRVDFVLTSAHRLSVSQVRLDTPETAYRNGAYVWHWRSGPLPPFFADPNGPSITDRSPFVQTSDFGRWSGLAEWYANWLDQRARMTPAFRARLLSLVPRGRNVPATVAAVWSYISAHLRYLGDEEGLHAYIPSPIETVFAAQQGDCKDGALLLSSWLRAEGIEAYLALVRTRHMGRVADGAATLAAFDHAVVFVPSLGQWIDTTAPSFHLRELPASDQGGLALIIRPHQDELTRIPQASPDENRTRRVVKLYPTGDGTMMAQGTISVQGADAPELRSRYSVPSARKRVFAQWLNRYFPGARVESVTVRGLEDTAESVDVEFRARVPERSAIPSAAWTARHYAPVLASELSRNDEKNLDLRWLTEESWSMPANLQECDTRSRDLPLDRISPFGEVHVHAACANGWLTVNTVVTQAAASVAEKDYPHFREFWLAADRDLNQPVLEVAMVLNRSVAKAVAPASIALRAPLQSTEGR